MISGRDLREVVGQIREIRPVHLELTGVEAWTLLMCIQLCLRDPDRDGPARDVAIRLGKCLQALICPPGTALERLAERGWERVFDEPRSQ